MSQTINATKEKSAIEESSPQPMVVLTFDDGPSAHTIRILNALRDNGARATFCILGGNVADNAGILRRMSEQGFEIIGHSWDHTDLTSISPSKIENKLTCTHDAIYEIIGVYPKLFRPPYGLVNSDVSYVSQALGLAMVVWSVDTMDWDVQDADVIFNTIMDNVKDGSIILCHDIFGSTADAMERVIPELIRRGYRLVTVSELLRYRNIRPLPGQVYSKNNWLAELCLRNNVGICEI